jgi:hypothetical protein
MRDMIMIIVVSICLVSCSKQFEPNDLLDPTSTIVKQLIKGVNKQ